MSSIASPNQGSQSIHGRGQSEDLDSNQSGDDISDSPILQQSQDIDSLRLRLRTAEREREDWMQRYFTLLSDKEAQERRVSEELIILETDARGLSRRVADLTEEKKVLTENVNELVRGNCGLQETLREQQERWTKDMKDLQRAMGREREACARELNAIGEQFELVKSQFQRYKTRPKTAQPSLETKVRNLKAQNAELKRDVQRLQNELKTLYSQSLTRSNTRRGLSSGRSHLSHTYKSFQKRENSIENMLTSVEAKLKKAHSLVRDSQSVK